MSAALPSVACGRWMLLVALVACGGSSTPPDDESEPGGGGETLPTVETGAITPESVPATTATGRGASEAEAIEVARQALREQVLGPWGREAMVALYDGDRDALEAVSVEGGYEARIGVTDARLREMLAALPERLPRPTFGAAFAEPLGALQEAAIARFVCERRHALLEDAECELTDLEPLIRAAAEAVRALELEPIWQGGVPTDAEGRLLRKPAVRLLDGDQPVEGLAGLPLVARPLHGDGEPVRTTVGSMGRALVNADPSDGLAVTLDRSRLLPPLGSVFPELRAALVTRQVSLRRWALVVASDRARDESTREVFGQALGEALRAGGARAEQPLEPSVRRAMKQASGSRRAPALRALADEQRGALDVVLIATVESRFASRMGSRRTWYEADAQVTAYLAWTGEALGSFEARANANGIGDARAERAAREKVARDVAHQLVARLLGDHGRS